MPPIFTMEDSDHCTDTKAGYVPLLPEGKEAVSPELQERSPCQVKPEPPHIKEEQEESSPSLVRVKPEPPHIKEEQEEVLLQRPEDADGSSLTLHGVIHGSGYVLHVENAEFLHLPVCKEEVSPEDQERNSSQGEELELPQIKEEQDELLQRPEEGGGSPLTLLAVKSEDDDENRETEPLASSTSPQHMKTQADVEDRGASRPTIDDQLPSSRSSESDIEDGDENREEKSEKLFKDLMSPKSFYCADCYISFLSKRSLAQHTRMHTHTNPNPKPYRYYNYLNIEDGDENREETTEGLSVLNALRLHSPTHRKRVEDCGTSQQQPASDNQLLSPPRSSDSHTEDGDVDREETREGLSVLNTSTRSYTGTKTWFNCTFCHVCFDNMPALKQHMRTHAVQKSFNCTDCDRTFRSKAAVRRHMHSHTNYRGGRSVLNTQKSHKKPAEGQTSLSEKLFKDLMLPIDKSFYCADCDVSFRSKKSMGQHTRNRMHNHTNPKPYYNYLNVD